MQKVLRFFLIISVLTSCGGSDKSKESAATKAGQQPPVMVDVIIAASQQVTNNIEVNGTVVANEATELHPEVSGRLTYLNIPEGRNVSQGTVLAKINDADLQAQLVKLRSQLALAEKTEERLKKLLEVEGINRADYDVAVNQVSSLKADIGVIQTNISRTVIRAPFTGTIGLRKVSPGAYITPQTILATIQQESRSKIDFTVPQVYVNEVSVGKAIVADVDGNKRKATVIAVEPEANSSTRNLTVRALVDNGILKPGSFAKIIIETSSRPNAILVPSSSIIPDARSKQVIVANNGKGVMTKVETGLRTEGGVEILSGLNAGDSVVVTGVLFVRPTSKLKVRSVKKLQDVL